MNFVPRRAALPGVYKKTDEAGESRSGRSTPGSCWGKGPPGAGNQAQGSLVTVGKWWTSILGATPLGLGMRDVGWLVREGTWRWRRQVKAKPLDRIGDNGKVRRWRVGTQPLGDGGCESTDGVGANRSGRSLPNPPHPQGWGIGTGPSSRLFLRGPWRRGS